MQNNHLLSRFAGFMLAAGGVLFLLAGVFHPQGASGSYRETLSSMLVSATWAASHWLALASVLVLAVAVWLLADSALLGRSPLARVGSRIAVIACTFMAVQLAVALAAPVEAEAYAAGGPASLVELSGKMQVLGWPALAVGFVLLAIGLPQLAPKPLVVLASAGGVALGAAGIVVEGFQAVSAGPLFIGSVVLAVWMVWAGVRLAVADVAAPGPVAAQPATG